VFAHLRADSTYIRSKANWTEATFREIDVCARSVVAAVGGGHEEGLLVRRHDRVEVLLEELPRACSHGCF